MNRTAATNIARIGYNAQDMLLEVQFHQDESQYCYREVPEDIWYRMKQAESLDMFFNAYILSRYEEQRREQKRSERSD